MLVHLLFITGSLEMSAYLDKDPVIYDRGKKNKKKTENKKIKNPENCEI